MYNVFEKLKDRPVYNMLDDISAHALAGGITIVNSETSSGKSLLVPLLIHQDTNQRVFVLEPRRFLAINAAENLSILGETVLGEEFGYLIGTAGSGEENKYMEEKTTVVFSTYGYALATKLIMEADCIVLDEIHEQSIDMAICKAMIKHRYTTGNPPKNLVLMSATLDVEAEVAYWKSVGEIKVFSAANGMRFPCEKLHRPAENPAVTALSLIDNGSKGVLVFAPGIGEIKEIINELDRHCIGDKYKNLIIDNISGQSEYEERKLALSAPPEGYVKILVGTNVIETGMNLPWVDAGVTTGEKKELHVRVGSGAVVLSKVPLAKSNVDQQAGRTNRFGPSTFIICGEKSYEMMSSVSSAEIDRLPLTALYMHCQGMDIDPNELEFMPQPKHDKMREASRKLFNLGFFDKHLKFTEDGRFIQNLPVGLETAAMLCHAAKLKILPEVIPMAAVYEMGSLRKDFTFGHGLDRKSDVFDSVLGYVSAMNVQNDKSLARDQKISIMENLNVGMRKYIETSLVIKSLEMKFNIKANFNCYFGKNNIIDPDGLFESLRQCILAASICNMGFQKMGLRGPIFAPAPGYETYQISKGSSVWSPSGSKPAAAKLRSITPKNGSIPFTVAEYVTTFSIEDIELFSEKRQDVFTKKTIRFGYDTYFVNGVEFISVAATPEQESGTRFNHKFENMGSLASALKEAQAKKASVS